MSDNPYQTPQGELIIPTNPSEAAGLYVVSKTKFIALNVATLGFYLTYWFYRNWRLHKQAHPEQKIWPVPRAIFSVFFVHALFRIANEKREQRGESLPKWNHSGHATITVVLLLIGNVCDRLSSRSIGSPLTDYIPLLLLIPITASITLAQGRINEACEDRLGESNSRFTAANYLWMTLGLVIWVLAGAGLFFITSQPIEY